MENEHINDRNELIFILVAGLPGSGKTTLAKKLSDALKMRYIGRDDYKVEIYDKYGFTNSQEKEKLDEMAEDAFCQAIRKSLSNHQSVIIDKWVSGSFLDVEQILNDFSLKKIGIYLVCDYKECTKRYNRRIYEPDRPRALSVIKHYPYVEGLSEIKAFSEEEMLERSLKLKKNMFGDYQIVIDSDINNAEDVFDLALTFIKEID